MWPVKLVQEIQHEKKHIFHHVTVGNVQHKIITRLIMNSKHRAHKNLAASWIIVGLDIELPSHYHHSRINNQSSIRGKHKQDSHTINIPFTARGMINNVGADIVISDLNNVIIFQTFKYSAASKMILLN